MRNSKFKVLYETIYNRYKQGAGFLEGDLVKLKDGYKTEELYKTLAETLKQRVEDSAKSGLNLRVGRLHTPYNQYGSYGHLNLPATHADLYQELSPGNFGNLITVPLSILEPVDTGVNLSPVSKKNKRSASAAPYQKPEKWDSNKDTPETKDQNHVGHKQNWVEKGDYKLADKNTKSSVGANKYDDNKPSKFKPLPKNKTLRESDAALALENVYMQLLAETADLDIDDEVNIAKAMDHDDDITSEAAMINGKEVDKQSLEIEDVDPNDYPDFSDAFVSKGFFKDGTEMSEDDLNEFNETHSDIVHELATDRMTGMGDSYEGKAATTEDIAPGQAAGGVLQDPSERADTEGPLESKNHMGEREFQTYSAWKRACKLIKPDAHFTGDKDIDGCEVGEWDGAVGVIYNKPSKAGSEDPLESSNQKDVMEYTTVRMSFDEFIELYEDEMLMRANKYIEDLDMESYDAKVEAINDIMNSRNIDIYDF